MDISLTSLDSVELPNPLVAISRLRKRARTNPHPEEPGEPTAEVQDEDELLVPPRKAQYRILGLPDTNEALLTLGAPQPITECVGCPYMCDKNFGCMFHEEFGEIIEFMRNNISRMKPVALAQIMADRYEKLRVKVNANLLPGQEPWPEWLAATIYEHMQSHHTDAQLMIVQDTRTLRHMSNISANASVIQNIHDQSVKLDEKQAKLTMDLKKLIYQIQTKNPKQMVSYNDDAFVEPKSQKAGPIHMSGKNLITRYMH